MIETVTNEKEIYPLNLAQSGKDLTATGPVWLRRLRSQACDRLAEEGFPSVRDEDWKYTNIAPIARIPFQPARYELDGLTPDALDGVPFSDLRCHRFVFVDGHHAAELSSIGPLSDGIKVLSLARVLKDAPELAEPYLGRYARLEGHAFNALNTAFMRDGAFVYVPKGKLAEELIHLVFLSTARRPAVVSHPRNLIVVEGNSQVTIVESYIGIGSEVYFTNPVTEIIAEEYAVVDHYKLQFESQAAFHVATLQFQQGRSSSVRSSSIALGGSLVRENLSAVLGGEGAECSLNGLYLVTGRQHIDNHTRIEHAKPHCNSRELYKGILDGRSRGVFHGRILVQKDAQKTDSKQTNNNLLLSDEALINTKPQLEIYADDVKCTHAATIGQLDRDAIFYLRSRGIGAKAAQSLLVYAFASEMIECIKVGALRAQLDGFLRNWLPRGEFVKEAVER